MSRTDGVEIYWLRLAPGFGTNSNVISVSGKRVVIPHFQSRTPARRPVTVQGKLGCQTNTNVGFKVVEESI